MNGALTVIMTSSHGQFLSLFEQSFWKPESTRILTTFSMIKIKQWQQCCPQKPWIAYPTSSGQ